jgi:hypothetical protein
VTSLAVCIDCAQRGANGYEPERVDYATDHPARYSQAVADNGGAYPFPSWNDGDTEPSFSRHACPFCGSPYAGDRIECELVGGVS